MTTVKIYVNKRNPNKKLEVHNDGHYHNSVKQFMHYENVGVKNFTGDRRLHRWRKQNLAELLEDYMEDIPEMRKNVPAKKKVGRPVEILEPRRNINVAVKVELLDKLDEVKRALGGNLTAYINGLIERDMEAHYDKYKAIMDRINELGL